MTTGLEEQSKASSKTKFGAKGIFAAVLGNGFEFYDFGVYAAYVVIISEVFFPSDNKFASLMASVGTFGAGFVARPLGGMFIGAMGDRLGRKPAMMLTIGLMALGSGLIGFLPGYHSIGVFAPILLVAARLIQGFAAGGEVGAATMFLLESAPPNRRCFYGSWQAASQGLASVTGGLLGFTLATVLSESDMHEWGWRIPFLLGVLIAPVGVWIRNKLDETHDHAASKSSTADMMGILFGKHWKQLLLATGVTSGSTIAVYFLVNMSAYALTELHLSARVMLFGGVVGGVVGAASSVVGGMLADRFGLKSVGIVPRLALVLLIWPVMAWLVAHPGALNYYLMVVIFGTLVGLSGSCIFMLMPYFFPPSIRSTGLSVAYAIGVMLFGGTAMPILTWLVHAFNDPLAGVYYVIVSNLLAVGCILAAKVDRITTSEIDHGLVPKPERA